jgi:hypothetical protein
VDVFQRVPVYMTVFPLHLAKSATLWNPTIFVLLNPVVRENICSTIKKTQHTNKLGEDKKYTQTNFHDISYSKSCLFLHEVSWACLNFKLLKQTTLKHSNPLFYWNLNSINTRYILIFSSWQAAIWRIYLVQQESCTRCIPTVM